MGFDNIQSRRDDKHHPKRQWEREEWKKKKNNEKYYDNRKMQMRARWPFIFVFFFLVLLLIFNVLEYNMKRWGEQSLVATRSFLNVDLIYVWYFWYFSSYFFFSSRNFDVWCFCFLFSCNLLNLGLFPPSSWAAFTDCWMDSV